MTQPPPRTPAKRKARELAKHLRGERPDYAYLKDVFRHLRAELNVTVQREPKALPYVPTEAEIRRYYQTVWAARRGGDIILIKTLLYTGVRVAELVRIRLDDVDLDTCRIRITGLWGTMERKVPLSGSGIRSWLSCTRAGRVLIGRGSGGVWTLRRLSVAGGSGPGLFPG